MSGKLLPSCFHPAGGVSSVAIGLEQRPWACHSPDISWLMYHHAPDADRQPSDGFCDIETCSMSHPGI
jgi:hypothetical protein